MTKHANETGPDAVGTPVERGVGRLVNEGTEGLTMTNKLDCDVLACQVDSLRAALLKVLDTREKEAKATLSFRTAVDNFSLSQPELDAHQRAMTAASSAEKEARLLLATLKTPNRN